MSLMRKHQQKLRGELAETDAGTESDKTTVTDIPKPEKPTTGITGWKKKHAFYESALDTALNRLGQHNSKEVRAQLKRDEIIPDLLPYLEEYCTAGQHYENRVLVQLVIWFFDIGDLERGLKWGFLALKQGQPMPQRFKRDLPTFIADVVLEWAEEQSKAGHSIQPYFGQVFEKVSKEWELFEKITANYYKLAALQLINSADEAEQKQCLALLEQADKLHAPVGVRTRINALKKKLKT